MPLVDVADVLFRPVGPAILAGKIYFPQSAPWEWRGESATDTAGTGD
jgi:hypothetical protein